MQWKQILSQANEFMDKARSYGRDDVDSLVNAEHCYKCAEAGYRVVLNYDRDYYTGSYRSRIANSLKEAWRGAWDAQQRAEQLRNRRR